MFDDLTAYFHENVESSFKDYRDVKQLGTAGRSRDIKTALIAATSLYHLREHLPAGYSLTRAAISSQCSDYGLLGDIVNASKHRSLTHGTPQISDATQIEECVVLTEYQDEQGPYRCVEKTVQVRLLDGSKRDVLEVMTNVMNFWQRYLHSIGVIAAPQNYTIPNASEPKSRSECADSRLDLEMVRGLRFRLTGLLQKYNYDTGKIEPTDLTGADVRFSIFPRVPLNIELSLKNEATGQQFAKTITLSEDESEVLNHLTTEEEKQRYAEGLPAVQEALRELAAEAGIPEGPAENKEPQ